MAGSRRSPVLRDPRSGDSDRDPRDSHRRRGRGSNRDRGRSRHRDRGGRQTRPSDRPFDYHNRSPPSHGSRFGPDPSRTPSDFQSPPRGPHGPSSGFGEARRSDHPRPPSSSEWRNTSTAGLVDKDATSFRREESPFGPPPKRKRTRSPSPRGQRPPLPPSRPSFAKTGERRDRSPASRNRGRFSGRGAPRGRSPHRARDRRGKDRRRPDMQRSGRSRSPAGGMDYRPSPDRRPRSPVEDLYDRDLRYRSRSVSRHSARSAASKTSVYSSHARGDEDMHSNRPIKFSLSNRRRSPSPLHRKHSFDGSNMLGPRAGKGSLREPSSTHLSDVHNKERRLSSRPDLDAGPFSTSSHLKTPTRSRPGSPQTGSPFSGGRGDWKGPRRQPVSGTSPNDSLNEHSAHGASSDKSYQNNHAPSNGFSGQHGQSSQSGQPRRGASSDQRGSQAPRGSEHQLSGSGHSEPAKRNGDSNLNGSHWTASGLHSRSRPSSPYAAPPHLSYTPSTRPPSAHGPQSPHAIDLEERPKSGIRTSQRDNDREPPSLADSNTQNMPPPDRHAQVSTPADKGGKFSFTFKAKTTPAVPKPVPDLAQRMQVREPPPRAPPSDPPTPRNRLTNGPMPKYKPEPRFDRRDRDRDRGRDPRDRRDFRDRRDPRDFHADHADRRDDRRRDNRRERRKHDRRPDIRDDIRQETSTKPPPSDVLPKRKKILTRPKPQPTLPDEFANSDSVYYRKPGNESVIGAGTYGKVFKGIHVYTQRKVALKKIRMEGEKDGFPVTAVREIKLLQHLRNHNVVSLLEVMVERNECFMVFEYLSHDLTGLINHPTFSLTAAHKKDLAKQMFEGLSYLHHRGVLHRDIKAANILISNTGLLKYADFGLARFFSKNRQLDYTNRVITIWYRPPELLLGETRYGPSVDVWSAACVCMEMFTKKAVFPGEGSELSQLDKIYNLLGTPTRAEWPDVVEMPWFQLMRPTERKKRVFEDHYRDVLTPAAMDMITQIFQYDPSKRPNADDVLKHPFFVSEEPAPQQAIELEHVEGDWHEFESKALRKEARRAEQQSQRDREKRKAEMAALTGDRDPKRPRAEGGDSTSGHEGATVAI